MSASVATGLQKYAGRRALATRLVRTRGPQANTELLFAVVYTPAAASHAIRAAFIELIADKMASLTIDGATGDLVLPFVVAGDWNASPGQLGETEPQTMYMTTRYTAGGLEARMQMPFVRRSRRDYKKDSTRFGRLRGLCMTGTWTLSLSIMFTQPDGDLLRKGAFS